MLLYQETHRHVLYIISHTALKNENSTEHSWEDFPIFFSAFFQEPVAFIPFFQKILLKIRESPLPV